MKIHILKENPIVCLMNKVAATLHLTEEGKKCLLSATVEDILRQVLMQERWQSPPAREGEGRK